MAIPFATKNELTALDEKITAAEQTPVASVRNTAPIYKHTIVMSGSSEDEWIKSDLTVTLYSTTNETLTVGLTTQEEIINKVLNNIIRYESIQCETEEEYDYKLPRGFAISSTMKPVEPEPEYPGIGFICILGYLVVPFYVRSIVSDTVGD